MGFYITGDIKDREYISYKVSELKQHINLSDYSWTVVYDDIHNFYPDDSKESFSGFINTVFANFYQNADATISQRFLNKNDELTAFFSDKLFSGLDKKTKDLCISQFLKKYEDDLIQTATSYSKGEGKKVRINKDNLDILRESSDSIYYDDSIGSYLKAIFEEYCSQQMYIREQIFFKEIIDKTSLAIANKYKLKLSTMQKINVEENHYYTRKFYFSPYRIVQDKIGSFNYLIGFSEELFTNGKIGKKLMSSFRISRIGKIDIMSSMSGFISKAHKDEIDKTIIKKNLQFLVGDLIDIEIKFTKKGIEAYNRQLYMRPQYVQKIDIDTYMFKCSEVQAMNYFFKFGKNAKIIAPLDLREKFVRRYQESLDAYNK